MQPNPFSMLVFLHPVCCASMYWKVRVMLLPTEINWFFLRPSFFPFMCNDIASNIVGSCCCCLQREWAKIVNFVSSWKCSLVKNIITPPPPPLSHILLGESMSFLCKSKFGHAEVTRSHSSYIFFPNVALISSAVLYILGVWWSLLLAGYRLSFPFQSWFEMNDYHHPLWHEYSYNVGNFSLAYF